MPKSNRKNLKKPEKSIIFFDYAAGAEVNPSSIHGLGVRSRKILEMARRDVGKILGAHPDEVIFTSGGTESNNLAIQGTVIAWSKINNDKILPHIITTNIEHPSVLNTFKMMKERRLVDFSIVAVEKNGIVDPKKIKKEIKKNTVLISVMYANNEIGTIQPIIEIKKEIRHYKKRSKSPVYPLLHTDAVQASNYLDLNTEKLGVDLMSLSGSKIEKSGGIGVLFRKKSVPLSPLFGGGDQEGGIRPGTLNQREILKFRDALFDAQNLKEKENRRLKKLTEYFIDGLKKISEEIWGYHGGIILNGERGTRLSNNINVTFGKIPSDLLVVLLSEKGIMASSRSACESVKRGGSYVIAAIREDALPEVGGVRFSFGRETNKVKVSYALKVLREILSKHKKWYN